LLFKDPQAPISPDNWRGAPLLVGAANETPFDAYRWSAKAPKCRQPPNLISAIDKAEIDRAKRKPTGSLDAYTLYLRGLAKFYQFGNRQANEEALDLFTSATEIDPEFASAYATAAVCYVTEKAFGWSSGTDHIVEVRRLTQRAVALGKDMRGP
jgi:hypothetical protein